MLSSIRIEEIIYIAEIAGGKIMKYYYSQFKVDQKDDGSPITDADRSAHEIIFNGLKSLYPNIPILSEEGDILPYEIRKNWEYFWLVDPLDGTREFIKQLGEFTVNIALIYKNEPIFGVVNIPISRETYYAKKGSGAYKNGVKLLKCQNFERKKIKVVTSRNWWNDKTKKFIETLETEFEQVALSSRGSSLKLCMLAEGKKDLYPRIAPTMEWDTAASHIILRETGRDIYKYIKDSNPIEYINRSAELEPLIYNKEDLHNPNFIAV